MKLPAGTAGKLYEPLAAERVALGLDQAAPLKAVPVRRAVTPAELRAGAGTVTVPPTLPALTARVRAPEGAVTTPGPTMTVVGPAMTE